MEELKPCPFCGGEASVYLTDAYEEDGSWIVDCEGGHTLVGSKVGEKYIVVPFETEAEAIEVWNMRSERTCVVVEISDKSESGNPDAFVKQCMFSCGHWGSTFDRYCRHCGAKVVDA